MNQGNSAIGADAVISRNPKVTYRDLEEGGVLLHLETGAYHGINATGSAIWKILEQDRTRAEVLDALRAELEGDPPGVEEELTAFLNGMVERDLLNVRGG